jgi:hypothetical protein
MVSFITAFRVVDTPKNYKNYRDTIKRVRVMVFNATSTNISVIPWWSVPLVEETGALAGSQTL